MIDRCFQFTVAALCRSLAEPRRSQALEADPSFDDIVRFVIFQHSQISSPLRPALFWATLVFDAAAFLRAAKPFHLLPLRARMEQVQRWKSSRWGPFRDLMRFYESLTLLAFFAPERFRV